jgi:predicted O-linked N-acetylglucosamine transferase (SPINDLY family)
VNDLPARRTGCITFGCFNALPKITLPLVKLWSEILLAVPGSRLVLKNHSLLDAGTRQRVQALLGNAGIDPGRTELNAYVPSLDGHLASYGRVDIALDTFPYHGTTTTCEALWMGVPVVTLAGQLHASRVGLSLLNNVGLPELIASTPAEYVQIAAALALDVQRLAVLRGTLRHVMQRSPLLDAPRFASNVESAYRRMWRNWCCNPLDRRPA